jgi:hypothetical protein
MLLAAGMPAYYVTVAADRADPQKFSHIYVCTELRDEGAYMCLDTGNRYTVPPGWEPAGVARKAIWTV